MVGRTRGKLSNAERVARWRQRQKESPSKYEEYKRKERERYQQKKERGVVRSIRDMTKREQRSKRKQWRQSSIEYYQRKKKILKTIETTLTPPISPDERPVYYQQKVARQLGRKKVRKDRSKAYREIFRLRVALKNEVRLKEKYKKRWQRQKKMYPEKKMVEDDIIKSHDVRKAVLLYTIIIKRMKERYRKTKSQEERRNISSLVCASSLIRRYKLGTYTRKMLGFTTHQMNNKYIKRKIQIKATRVKLSVHNFLERDDNSRIKADKKATITRKEQKKQIRLLNDDLKHLHEKFNSEIGQRTISYSLFCKLRPFWIRPPTAKDRETCLCKVHENLAFKLVTANMSSIVHAREVSCFCNRLNVSGCSCFRPVMTVFDKINMSDIVTVPSDDLDRNTSNKNSAVTKKDASPSLLTKVIAVDEYLIGQWAVVDYDGLPYPGEVLDVDEDDVEVKVMHKIGQNRFFWSLIPDILWYKKEKVITLLEGPPEKVTGRHCQIQPDFWRAIEKEMNL